MSTALTGHSVLELDQLLIRKNVFTIFGAKFRVFSMDGRVVATSKQKAFKLKEDIRVYADESKDHEMLCIKARAIIDFGAAYDVVDSITGEKIGALRRKGMASLFRDEWHILDLNDEIVGTIMEDSGGLAFLRRFLINLIPQTFNITLMGEPVGFIKQHFNPFVYKATMDLSIDQQRFFDRRLAIASAILIIAIEGRQK